MTWSLREKLMTCKKFNEPLSKENIESGILA